MQRTPPPTRATSPASTKENAEAPKKTQPAGKAEKPLPCSASDVTDQDSYQEVVRTLLETIKKAVKEGKSVTAANKNLIHNSVAEIGKATTNYFDDSRPNKNSHSPPKKSRHKDQGSPDRTGAQKGPVKTKLNLITTISGCQDSGGAGHDGRNQ
ncbi:unnamed protein product [Euphydryas editha]|uniref:Uncharacterized protein n=1 Tax=Euphydryas editha TaxID=104508 RepID=A0AAU9TQ40_EUPED|nr:unnamed protein product [Euphydryas editha]